MSLDLKKIAVAGAIAAPMRADADRNQRRVVHVYNQATGETTGHVSAVEAQEGLLRALSIEFAVADGTRPDRAVCRNCGRVLAVSRRGGPVPKLCRDGCERTCIDCGGEVTRKGAYAAAREGRSPRCKTCATKLSGATVAASLSSEERSRRAKKRFAAMSDEERAAHGARLLRAQTEEGRALQRERTKEAQARMTPEERAERARKAWATRRARQAQTVSVLCPTTTHHADTTDYADSENKASRRIPNA